jgi:hypothetical protein
MQPPQGPNQPPYQQPQQPQPPYQQPQQYQQPYGQNPYQRGYEQRPGRGYGTASAGGFDIFMGVVLILLALGGMLFGGIFLATPAIVNSAANDRPELSRQLATLGANYFYIFGAILLVWSLIMLISAIGIFRFRKWAMIVTAIQGLIAAGYFVYTLIAASGVQLGASNPGVVVTIIFAAFSLLYTIYGFARAGAAS